MNHKEGILLCILIFTIMPSLLAQPDLSRKISIHATELPLEKVMDEISEKSGIIFSYNSRKLPLDQPVTTECANRRLTRTCPARFDLATRIAAVSGRCAAIVALFGSLDDSVATDNRDVRGSFQFNME